jgi:hypothetical protein
MDQAFENFSRELENTTKKLLISPARPSNVHKNLPTSEIEVVVGLALRLAVRCFETIFLECF